MIPSVLPAKTHGCGNQSFSILCEKKYALPQAASQYEAAPDSSLLPSEVLHPYSDDLRHSAVHKALQEAPPVVVCELQYAHRPESQEPFCFRWFAFSLVLLPEIHQPCHDDTPYTMLQPDIPYTAPVRWVRTPLLRAPSMPD